MAKIMDYIRRSIKAKMTAMMVMSLSLILLGAVVVPWGTLQSVQKFDQTTNQLRNSQEHITNIANETNEIILRVRGYFAYLDSYEYNHIFEAKDKLDKALASFKSTPLSDDEKGLVERVETFFDNYINRVLPQGAAFAEKGDYTSLRKLITLGANNPVNEIILYAQTSEKLIQTKLKAANEKLLNNLFYQGVYFIVYIMVVIVLSIYIMRKLATDIGNPLGRLAQYAVNYEKGIVIEGNLQERKDEIGYLTRSLNSMIYDIQEQEEELLAQNEELQAQQDELHAQQDELQQAISIMEDNEQYLNKRNLLNQSLANTLDKKELLHSIVRNIVEITGSEKGLMKLMNDSNDYAAYGVSQEEAVQFMNGFEQSPAIRAMDTKKLYIRERAATAGEKGYVSEPIQAVDIYVPLFKGNNEISAVIVLTRVGKAVANREEQEIKGLAGQISLSLEKLEMYEASENQRQMTRDILNTIQAGVQFVNLEGQMLLVNEKLNEMLELSPNSTQLAGKSIDQIQALLGSKIEGAERLFEFQSGAILSDETHGGSTNYVLYKKSSQHYIQMYWEPIYRNKQKFGVLFVHRDITKEHEVDRMKSEFVSTVSHELRTPLASILGFSELLLHRELKPERQRKYMSTIHQEAKRLTQLVNDFLDLQRMENGMQFYDQKPFDLIPLIEEVKEIEQTTTSNHAINWNTELEHAMVLGDRDKIYQVMINLISNAIKYSPAGGRIQISSRLDGGSIRIDISDEGLGIPESAISSLFSKFYRVDNSDRREIGGTGLGLAIVKEIVTQHQGTVSVKSKIGEGSTFTFLIPMYIEEANVLLEAAATKQHMDSTGLNVMLVENDHSLSIMLRDELVEKGYHTAVYVDGLSALDAMEQEQPDLLILDLKLAPELSGWEVIERMKASKKLRGIPIIISSAFEEKERALALGITHFLIKPYIPAKLIEAIEQLLESQKGEEKTIDPT
ncbi:MAG: ATP-binding protein [Candidatus Cohnella colombiensis]|uniref:histidine kinase n=1 Tax=Candidatus Cohnella colombiensis TaxID=3121368 RepID=A0AA95JGJ1_9BACL|nr:MAG: ATP-binding protein [Cohnella sp.]